MLAVILCPECREGSWNGFVSTNCEGGNGHAGATTIRLVGPGLQLDDGAAIAIGEVMVKLESGFYRFAMYDG